MNEQAKSIPHPIDPDTLLTGQGGQVRGLGKDAVMAILGKPQHGITRVLA